VCTLDMLVNKFPVRVLFFFFPFDYRISLYFNSNDIMRRDRDQRGVREHASFVCVPKDEPYRSMYQ
jgi:hypothetical protein